MEDSIEELPDDVQLDELLINGVVPLQADHLPPAHVLAWPSLLAGEGAGVAPPPAPPSAQQDADSIEEPGSPSLFPPESGLPPPKPKKKRCGRRDNNYELEDVTPCKRRSRGMRRIDGLMAKSWEAGDTYGFRVFTFVMTDHGRVAAYANGPMRELLADAAFVDRLLSFQPDALETRRFEAAAERREARTAGYSVPSALDKDCSKMFVPLVRTTVKRRGQVDLRPRDAPGTVPEADDYWLDVALPGARRDGGMPYVKRPPGAPPPPPAKPKAHKAIVAKKKKKKMPRVYDARSKARALVSNRWLEAADPVQDAAALAALASCRAMHRMLLLVRVPPRPQPKKQDGVPSLAAYEKL